MSSNNLEDLLRERLNTGSSGPLPSPGFEDRVRSSLTPRSSGGRRRARLVRAMVGVAAILALAAVAVPWMAAPRRDANGVGSESPSATPSPTSSATPARLAHAEKWFLSFDYPSDWTVTDRSIAAATGGLNTGDLTSGEPSVFGLVGNNGADEQCLPNPPAHVYACTTKWSLGAGTIAMRFEVAPRIGLAPRPSYLWTGREAVEGPEIPGAEALMIDGLPARFAKSPTDAVPYSTETVPGATEVLWWGLTSQQQFSFGYSIVAAIEGPNVAQLEAQAKALVAGIHYVPETAMLPTDPVAFDQVRQAVLERALTQQKDASATNKDLSHAWDCFPTVIGASATAVITHTPITNPLTRPLPVTCTLESMVPTVMQGWTLTLSQSWVAGSDYGAGTANTVLQMSGDGLIWEWGFGGPFHLDPAIGKIAGPTYPHQGRSNYPG